MVSVRVRVDVDVDVPPVRVFVDVPPVRVVEVEVPVVPVLVSVDVPPRPSVVVVVVVSPRTSGEVVVLPPSVVVNRARVVVVPQFVEHIVSKPLEASPFKLVLYFSFPCRFIKQPPGLVPVLVSSPSTSDQLNAKAYDSHSTRLDRGQ